MSDDASRIMRTLAVLSCLAQLTLLIGCAASNGMQDGRPQDSYENEALAAPDSARQYPISEFGKSRNASLESLWRARTGSDQGTESSSNFTLGPGDVLIISLPQLDQAKDRTVRVSEQGTISLPMLGEINVAGMSQEELRNELSSRVSKYVYKPQVAVYLQQSQNQLVSVLGAVKTPGRYMLSSNTDTLMTMISQAGGVTEDAASRIIVFPASAVRRAEREQTGPALVKAGMTGFVENETRAKALNSRAGEEGIVIDLSRYSSQRYLTMPARAGDVIVVPAAGQVSVQGWVEKPGSYKITPAMTVLGAVAAAGGALFSSSATLLREQGDGNKLVIPVDLSQTESGAESDIPLQDGDIVMVDRSLLGAVPYSLYFLVNRSGVVLPFPAIP